LSFVEKLGKSIRHAHLNDNRGGTSSKDDLVQVGIGSIDFESILGALATQVYDGTISPEVNRNFRRLTGIGVKTRLKLLCPSRLDFNIRHNFGDNL
jgi:sugar phosphate isomerase/epimerase